MVSAPVLQLLGQKVEEIHPWQPLGTYFFIFTLEFPRSYLVLLFTLFLTCQPFYDTFKSGFKR